MEEQSREEGGGGLLLREQARSVMAVSLSLCLSLGVIPFNHQRALKKQTLLFQTAEEELDSCFVD